jgi:hypothetical protein
MCQFCEPGMRLVFSSLTTPYLRTDAAVPWIDLVDCNLLLILLAVIKYSSALHNLLNELTAFLHFRSLFLRTVSPLLIYSSLSHS